MDYTHGERHRCGAQIEDSIASVGRNSERNGWKNAESRIVLKGSKGATSKYSLAGRTISREGLSGEDKARKGSIAGYETDELLPGKKRVQNQRLITFSARLLQAMPRTQF